MENFKEKYTVIAKLQDGGVGRTIYTGVQNNGGKSVIIKQAAKYDSLEYEEQVPLEVAMLLKVQDVPGACKIMDWYDLIDQYIIVMEKLADTLDLFDYITECGNSVNENDALTILKNVTRTVIGIDELGLVHRDIKPENILVNKNTLDTVLIDFDACTYKTNEPFTEPFGTKLFNPPELFSSKSCNAVPATVWSLGLTMYNMIYGDIPFSKESDIKYDPKFTKFEEPTRGMVRCMMLRDPQYRYDLTDVAMALDLQK